MKYISVILLCLGIALLWLLALCVVAWVWVWNLEAMFENGVNFWNCFWMVLTAALLLGGSNEVSK